MSIRRNSFISREVLTAPDAIWSGCLFILDKRTYRLGLAQVEKYPAAYMDEMFRNAMASS